jgi:hypothetical protein
VHDSVADLRTGQDSSVARAKRYLLETLSD